MRLNPFKRKKKKPDRIEIVKNSTLNRIQAFRKHFSKKNRDDNFIQFFHIVRLFFAGLFKIKYEFTFEELSKELGKRRIDKNLEERTLFFLKKLSVVEYSNEKLPDSELKKLLNDFLKLFEKFTFDEPKFKETKLNKILMFLRLKRPAIQKKEHLEKQGPSLTSKHPILSKLKLTSNKRKLEKVHNLLIKAFDLLDNNKIQKSMKLYVKIKEEYNQMNTEEKKQVYDDILLLYKELVSSKKV